MGQFPKKKKKKLNLIRSNARNPYPIFRTQLGHPIGRSSALILSVVSVFGLWPSHLLRTPVSLRPSLYLLAKLHSPHFILFSVVSAALDPVLVDRILLFIMNITQV